MNQQIVEMTTYVALITWQEPKTMLANANKTFLIAIMGIALPFGLG